MGIYNGICVSNGSAQGPVFKIKRVCGKPNRSIGCPEYELELFEKASEKAISELVFFTAKCRDKDIKEIFDIQRLILTDVGMTREIANYIKAGASAVAAVERAAGIFASQLRKLNDGYFSERSTDVLDICGRVIAVLNGEDGYNLPPTSPSILVSEEIYPTDIACYKRKLILGMVSANGSENSHAAIIARSLKIPFIVNVGSEFLLNCNNNNIYINADKGTARFIDKKEFAKSKKTSKSDFSTSMQNKNSDKSA